MSCALYSYDFPTNLPHLPMRSGLILEWNGRYGEIAPLPGFSHETLDEAKEEILSLMPDLATKKARLPSVQFAIDCAKKPFPPAPFRIPIAAFQREKKLFSLEPVAKLSRQGKSKILNQIEEERQRLSVPDDDACPKGQARRQGFNLVQKGDFTCRESFATGSLLKLKLGHLSVTKAIQHVQEIYRSMKGFRLRVDFNCKWNLQDALHWASHFPKALFDFIEEPVSDFADLITFSKLTQFPIGIDEHFRLYPDQIQKIPTLKAVVIKPTLSGYIPDLPSFISPILSSSYETSLGLLQIARNASPSFIHGLDTHWIYPKDTLLPSLKIQDGFLIWEGGTLDKTQLCYITSK